MTFLKARWKNLIFVNYEIDPAILAPYVPEGTELDLYKGKCHVSIVAFMFMDVKVLGIKLFRHVNFEEVNLRFYVKHKGKRGVVFIQEIVPKPLITFVANTIYHEHYCLAKMDHQWSEDDDSRHFEYRWKASKKNQWQTVAVTTEKEFTEIEEDSEEQFITEHYWGYTKHGTRTYEYEVVHPTWRQLKIKDIKLDIDFEANYGKDFSFLQSATPSSVILAEGSEVSVRNKRTVHR